MKFLVWANCDPSCEYWQAPRVTDTVTDPVEAIELTILYRDSMHDSWITIEE